MTDWNPFGDDNFGVENDDMMFGEEFDKIRRGSNTSMTIFGFFIVTNEILYNPSIKATIWTKGWS